MEQNQESKDTSSRREYIFSVEEDKDGLRIEFTTPENQDDSMSPVDISMVVIALFKMLKESGLTQEQLNEFMSNISQEVDTVEAVSQGEIHVEKKS